VPADQVVTELRAVLGAEHVITDPDVRSGYETDWTGRYSGRACCVARPGSTDEVVAVMRVCARARVAAVPQGGNTGLVGGGVPRAGEVVLSTRRLTVVEPVDVDHGEVVAGAGVTLGAVSDLARASGWDVGVDLASRDSATVGGMVATNAGGEHVLRYGPMRRQLLGVEAVLADGGVVGKVPALRKDNTGYDWAGVLSGSEGTLGVVTRVHLALVPLLPERVVALLGLDDLAAALRVAGVLQRDLASLLALEAFFADGLELVRRHGGPARPFTDDWPAYLLVESGGRAGSDGGANDLAALLARCNDVRATAVATDASGRSRLWAYRERHTEAINAEGVPHKLDVTLPYARLVDFASEARAVIAAEAPDARVVLFGHVGDGNLHVNILGLAPDDDTVDHEVLRLVSSMGGSISAEHGIGVAKRNDLSLSRTAADIDAMWALKRALDPMGILNPGVLLPRATAGP
jgi:FAD/FMN-containing dehydrogenase